MSAKTLDSHGRWRNKVVSFRVLPEENDLIALKARLSGMSKQNYLILRCLASDVVVVGNPRVYKALKEQMRDLCEEISRISDCTEKSPEFWEVTKMVLDITARLGTEGND